MEKKEGLTILREENEKQDIKLGIKKNSAVHYAAEFFIKIGLTILVIWVLFTYVFGIYIIHDNTAYPMLKDGDLCIIYRLGDLYANDEIVYSVNGKTRFGRVVALPGDTVDINSDELAINGYGVFENTVYPTSADGAAIEMPYIVPDGAAFVLNDYRPDMSDSRTYGAFPKEQIKGKVVFVMRRRGI